MANLPDVDTTNTSFLAYWNAIDQGGLESVAPEEALSSGSIVSYTLYDNGVEGVYSTSNANFNATFRIKNDGWIVAYMDTATSYPPLNSTTDRGNWDYEGLYNIANGWDNRGSAASVVNNPLERCINDLFTQLSNSGNGTYDAANVGLYNYLYQSATSTTLLSHNGSGSRLWEETVGFSYTSDTGIFHHDTVTSVDGKGRYDSQYAEASFNGHLCSSGGGKSGGNWLYAVDTVGEGLAPSANTEYTATLGAYSNNTSRSYTTDALISHIIVWG